MSDNIKSIEQILAFMVEIEKLKDIQRKTKPVGLDRYENSAEHSWHVALSALMLKDYANKPIIIEHVIKMLLIHDLGEIDAGDVIVYDSDTAKRRENELAGIKRVFGILPPERAQYFISLWEEFEDGETDEAKFARAIDRIPPLLHNLRGDGNSWLENNIKKEKVFALNSRIGEGSGELWTVIEKMLTDAVDAGTLL